MNGLAQRMARVHYVALTDFVRNNCPYMAAAIAYWALFSAFPLTLAAVSVLGFLYDSPQGRSELIAAIVNQIPVSAEYLASLIDDVVAARGTLSVIAVAGLLFAGTSVFSAIRKGINHTWHIGRPPYFLVERAVDFGLLVGVLGAAVITGFLGAWLWEGIGSGSIVVRVVFRIVAESAILAVTFAMVLVLYKVTLNTTVRWRDLWTGALVSAVLFQATRIGFGLFVGHFAQFSVVYGALGALMALLVWAYLSALSLLWGSQLAYVYSTHQDSWRGVSGSLGPASWTRDRRIAGTMKDWLIPGRRPSS